MSHLDCSMEFDSYNPISRYNKNKQGGVSCNACSAFIQNRFCRIQTLCEGGVSFRSGLVFKIPGTPRHSGHFKMFSVDPESFRDQQN